MRLLRRVRARFRDEAAPRLPDDLDPSFYRAWHPDLADLRDGDLIRHFIANGRAEGRFGKPDALIAALEQVHGALPEGFNPNTYRGLNPDLAQVIREPWAFTAHYLEFGRREGRRYSAIDPRLARDFARLLRADGLADASLPDEVALARYLQDKGLAAGPWLDDFDLVDFSLANAAWLPPVTSKAAALRLFVEQGIDGLAPIAMALPFDAAFYRDAYAPGGPVARTSDADLYRYWLASGSGRGEAPSEAVGLDALIGTVRFPGAFDEAAYRRQRPGAEPTRFRALAHFILESFPTGFDGVVTGPGAADLYGAIGDWHERHWAPEPAARAFARALSTKQSASLWHGRGEALLALGQARPAAEAYEQALSHRGAVARSAVRAAELRTDLGEPAIALDHLARHPAPDLQKWRDAAARAIHARFGAASAAARDHYERGDREAGDAALEAAIADTVRDWERFAFLPGRLPLADAGPIVILANRDLPQCVHYRVEQKRRQLEHGGWTVEIHDQNAPGPFIEALTGARAAIFYRVPAFPDVVRAILHAQALGVPTLYEVDDLIFDAAHYPDPYASFEGQITRSEYAGLLYGVPLFRGAMALCEIGLASTPALAEAMRPVVRSKVCHVLRNGLDQRNDPFLARPARAPSGRDAPITIFYGSGTKAHNADFTRLAAPGLLALLAEDPRVRLVVAGYLALDRGFDPYRGRVIELGFTRDVDAYWEALSAADISLAVLSPGAAADAKSEIKWLEAAMLGIPSVLSPTRTYREILSDGETALFADTAGAWEAALRQLAADPERRRAIGAAARQRALADYTLERGASVLAGFLPAQGAEDTAWGTARTGAAQASAAALARGRTRPERFTPLPLGSEPSPLAVPGRPARKPRVLIVNVFLPPQTIGGATRVVRDNLDHFIDHATDRFELVLAAVDDGADTPYATRVDAYRGVPVFRIATPREAHMDWRPTDPTVGALFEAFLARVSPDLIHFHAIQRLSVSVVEAARRRGIPYYVTVHDGWWLSDDQFFIDEDGQPRPPSSDPLAGSSDDIGRAASLARRLRLGRALAGARRVLAVSESFAALYREASVANAIAVPNGLPALPAPGARAPSLDGRVRLGHLGGLSSHKGAPLLEAVLRTTPLRNLTLTIVDLVKDFGHATQEVWGTTPVTIIGRQPQEAMPELYRRLDVVVAPSLWPESFGLVAREAAAYGLWVVATDRGAMAEDVRPGIDGFVIDVSSVESLRETLLRIDAEPERFATPPPRREDPVRLSADQSADLLKLYDRVLLYRADTSSPGDEATMSVFDDPRRYVNVAPGKRASQSSRTDQSVLGPEGAINGDLEQAFGVHTDLEDHPWWQLDLVERYPLDAIVVHNRQDVYPEWARRLRLEISDDAETWTTVHSGYCHFGSAKRGSPLILPLGGLIWARYVKISLDERRHLVLAQVQVFVSRANLDLMRMRDELGLTVGLDGEREGINYFTGYNLIAAPEANSDALVGFALKENGAFGNCMLQYATAIVIAKRMGLRYIKVADKDRSEMIRLAAPLTLDGLTFIPGGQPLPPVGQFLNGYFFGIEEFRSVVPDLGMDEAHPTIRSVVRKVFNLLPPVIPPKPDDELHIHIRSGDIFAHWVNSIYTQPPLSFYQLVVERFLGQGKISRVKLVYENKLNPVIEPLEDWLQAKGLPFTVSSGDVRDDVVALVNARYLVFGFGSFGPGVCHFSDAGIDEVVYFAPGHEQGFRGIPTVRKVTEVIDAGGGYIKIGEWTNAPEQRALMVDYPVANLSVIDEPAKAAP